MKIKSLLHFAILFYIIASSFSQVGIGTTTPNSAAILHLESTNQALLLTRIAKDSDITNPVEGLLYYNTSEKCIKLYQSGKWTGTDCSTPPPDPHYHTCAL